MKINILINIVNVLGNFFMIFPSRTVSVLGVEFDMWGAGLGVEGAPGLQPVQECLRACRFRDHAEAYRCDFETQRS